MIAILCISIIVIALVWIVVSDMRDSNKGVGEQSDESKKMIERENEMLMSRMIDYSENINQ